MVKESDSDEFVPLLKAMQLKSGRLKTYGLRKRSNIDRGILYLSKNNLSMQRLNMVDDLKSDLIL